MTHISEIPIKEVMLREYNTFNNIDFRLNMLLDIMDDYKFKLSDENIYILSTSIDIIQNTTKAIQYFIFYACCQNNGEKYLRLYGLLQSLKMQQNTIVELFTIFFKENVSFKFKDGFLNISNLWEDIIGAPLCSENGTYCNILSNYFDNYHLPLTKYNTKEAKEMPEQIIQLRRLINQHLEELEEWLKIFIDKFSKI